MNLKTLAVTAIVATTAVVGVVYFTKKRNQKKAEPTPAPQSLTSEPVVAAAEPLKETDAEVVGVQVHTAEGVPVGETNNVYSLLEQSKKRQQQSPTPKPKTEHPGTKRPVPEYFRNTVKRAKSEGAHS